MQLNRTIFLRSENIYGLYSRVNNRLFGGVVR